MNIFLLDYNLGVLGRDKFISKLISGIHKATNNLVGFRNNEDFQQHLQFQIFGDEKIKESKKLSEYDFDKSKISKIIKSAVLKSYQILPSKQTKVFILPTFNQFIENKMGGVSGFSPQKNTMLIYLNPTIKNWEIALRNTICHEYNHAVVYNFHHWTTLLDGIIFEGLAEHFREQVASGKRSPWTKAVSKQKCQKYFLEIREKLNSKNQQLRNEIFFGSKKYPLWLGYSLGYYIVKSFLDKNKKESWINIIRMKPEKILKQSNFIN